MERKDFYDALTSYEKISRMLKTYSYGEILEQAAATMQARPEELEAFPVIEPASADGSYRAALRDLLKNIIHYDRIHAQLGDEMSRTVFANLIGYRVLPAQSFRKQACQLSIADDIPDKGSFSEVVSLLKEKRPIREDFPRLLFDVGCTVADVWRIPVLVDAIRSDYLFLLRHYENGGWQRTCLYALPTEKKAVVTDTLGGGSEKPLEGGSKEILRDDSGKVSGSVSERGLSLRKRRQAVALAPYERGWNNAELLKDCGLIPYLLFKDHNCDVTMVGAPMEDSSNLKYIEGVQLEFLPDGTQKSKEDYIRRAARQIDVLILRGFYPDYLPVVELYKKENPGGKVYLPLDANSGYMDRILWQKPFIKDFMERCDVICTSGKAMQRHLNEKWPWVIEHIPNGFYCFSDREWDPSFEKKKNVILTVGRLGTEQKATHVLLEAFAKAGEALKDWELHLAGTLEKGFEDYLDWYWQQFPGVKERVRFLGQITQKETLYEEYLEAKLFALTSAWEGGTPNVIAEALYAGDVIAITKIDEYEEATDNGRCGKAAEIGDVAGFRDLLIDLCCHDRLEEMSCHAYEYAKQHFDMERIVAKVYDLIFGEDA